MVRRKQHKRITVHLEAEIIIGGKSYAGVIENMSECGICISTSLSEIVMIIPETTLEVKFKSTGEEINLQCKAVWVLIKKIPSGLRYKMGLGIIESPFPEYKEFIKTLFS